MRTLTVVMFVSLDGVIQAPGGRDEDRANHFDLGGWFLPISDAPVGAQIRALYTEASAFLLGRCTYDIWSSYWPHQPDDHPIAHALNTRPKFVVSTTLREPAWAHTTVIATDVVAQLRALRADGDGALLIQGSAQLVQTLFAHGLVDELVLFTAPVVLGAGKRLFTDGAQAATYAVVESQITPNGIVCARYRPVGPVAQQPG